MTIDLFDSFVSLDFWLLNIVFDKFNKNSTQIRSDYKINEKKVHVIFLLTAIVLWFDLVDKQDQKLLVQCIIVKC